QLARRLAHAQDRRAGRPRSQVILYLNWNPAGSVALRPSVFVTFTSTLPFAPEGVTQVIFDELTTTTLVATLLPISTVAPASKPVPLIVRFVPPDFEPEFGEIEVRPRIRSRMPTQV